MKNPGFLTGLTYIINKNYILFFPIVFIYNTNYHQFLSRHGQIDQRI